MWKIPPDFENSQILKSMWRTYWEQSHIPSLFSQVNLSDFDKKIISTIINDNQKKLFGSMYLYGGVGVGKTHLMCAIMREIAVRHLIEREQRHIKQEYGIVEKETGIRSANYDLGKSIAYEWFGDFQCRFCSMPNIFLEIRETFNNPDKTESSVIEKYTNIPHLFIDDFGVEKVTEWTLQTVYIILNTRYEQQLKTTFTSNYTINDICNMYGERISSRVVGMVDLVAQFKGGDRRTARE